MASGRDQGPLALVQRLFGAGTLTGLGESQLLSRFVDNNDEVAFEAIVARHGPMVLGVCRRRLRDPNDVDDAFQATFLVLVKKADSLRDRDGLGPWLHGVARRVASRARTEAAHRSARLRPLGGAEATPKGCGRDDNLAALDEEIERLPETFRLPIVLCHLEGCSYEEAAMRLQWSVGMVRGRLARGRERLRDHLSQRGVAPFTEDRPAEIAPSLSPVLLLTTIKMAMGHAASGEVPAVVTNLVEGVSRSMIFMKSKAVVSFLLSLTLLFSGALVLSARDSQPQPSKVQLPGESQDNAPPDLHVVRKALKGWWGTLETLSFREESFVRGNDSRRDHTKAFSRLNFALAPGNRFAYDLREFHPDGLENLILKKRWDGQKLYHFYPAGKNSKEIRLVAETPQKEPRNRYDGEMSNVMWLIFPTHPSGRPPAAPIDRGASLEVKRDAQGHQRVFLVDDKDREVRSELDPDHGWMPKRVEIGPTTIYTATKFALKASHWFPVEGTHIRFTEDGKPMTIAFEVFDLRINQPIPESEFNLVDFAKLPIQKQSH